MIQFLNNFLKNFIESMDHQYDSQIFATCGEKIALWDENRSEPTQIFSWGPYNAHHVKFNNVEQDILACCTMDKGILLYDSKSQTKIRKLVLNLESNALAWNPMEAFTFTVGCSDYKYFLIVIRISFFAYQNCPVGIFEVKFIF